MKGGGAKGGGRANSQNGPRFTEMSVCTVGKDKKLGIPSLQFMQTVSNA
jgi:hypothetical protein